MFAHHFDMTIKEIISAVNSSNSNRKLYSYKKFFVTRDEIRECLSSLKCKNSEGFEWIPQRISWMALNTSWTYLQLFKKICNQRKVQAQWLIAKNYSSIQKQG
jgi:hypothetical protein